MTIKQIALLTAKAGMPRESFIRCYEEGHAPLILRLLPVFDDYRRSYVVPDSGCPLDHLEGAQPAFPFDVVTELRFTGQSALDDMKVRVTESHAGEQIAEDEINFFDRGRMAMFGVDERRTDPKRLAIRPAGHRGPPAVKVLAFLDARADLSRDAFIEGYEAGHAELSLRLLVRDGVPLFARYARNYPIPGERFPVGTSDPAAPLAFDVITEVDFWTNDDWQAFRDLCARPDVGAALAEDEARIFDRTTARVLVVDEYVSPGLPGETLTDGASLLA